VRYHHIKSNVFTVIELINFSTNVIAHDEAVIKVVEAVIKGSACQNH
jgi:hypothetical protein